jgi:hypothetical protein
MKKAFLLALVFFAIIGLSQAATIAPRIYEQDDFGDPIFKQFTYSISTDCTAATIQIYVLNASNKPVQNAGTYLKYIDFSSPLLSHADSDKDGYTLHRLPGQVTLMRGLFILVIEKNGYRSKEVHFDLSPCWTNYTYPQPPPPKPPGQNGTQPPQNSTNGTTNTTNGGSGSNMSWGDGNGNGSQDGVDGNDTPALCPASFVLLLLLFFKADNA